MPSWDERPEWKRHEDDGYVMAARDPLTGVVETVEPLYVTHEMGHEDEPVTVVVLHLYYMTPNHVIPTLQVLLPGLCGHFHHGGCCISEVSLN
jgi:hypothetical protein